MGYNDNKYKFIFIVKNNYAIISAMIAGQG